MKSSLLGRLVRHKKTGKLGMVVPGPSGKLMVEWDGEGMETEFKGKEVEILRKPEIRVDHRRCQNCVFYNGGCQRHTPARWGMILTNGKKVNLKFPKRIFPHCQA
jgi:hypothetical protein